MIRSLISVVLVLLCASWSTAQNYSLDFDGADDYVDLSNIPSSTNYSIEFWVKFDEVSGTDHILNNKGSSGNHRLYRSGTQLWFRTALGGSNILRQISNSITANKWYHIALIRENATLVNTYLDGVPKGGANSPSSNGFTSNMVLGTHGSSDFFKGQIDEFRIWNGPRTHQQILDNRNTELSGNEPNLVVYYKFDDRQALLVDDCTANSFDGIKRSSSGLELPQPDTCQALGLIDAACSNCSSFVQYRDSDEDGFGDINSDTMHCEFILDGYVQNSTDCNDTDSLINILALEVSDGIDNNCNGQIDEPQLSLNFDGADDYVDLSNIPSSTNYSIEFWINFDEVSGTDHILNNNGSSTNHRLYRVGTELWFRTASGGSNIFRQLSNSIIVDKWYHVVLIRESATLVNTYLDGVPKGGANSPSSNGFTSNMVLGNYGSSDFFKGQIDEFRVWNGPRTHQQILDNRNTELSGTEPNLVVYYKFDDRQALLVDDCTANSFDGIKRSSIGLELPQPDTCQVLGLIDVACSNCNYFSQYRDLDKDGFGDINSDTIHCEFILNGYVQDSTDCNDADSLINILALEVSDGIDNNCNGQIDEPQLSLNFDGADDYVDLSNIPSSTNYSIEFWINFDEVSGTDHILNNNGSSTNHRLYRVGTELWFRTASGGSNIFRQLSNSIIVDKWYHVVLIRESATLVNTYLDGVPKGGANSPSSNGFTSNMVLGNYGSSDFFKGQIDEFRIWNGSRTHQEIIDNRYKELSGVEPNLVAYYKFDDDLPIQIIDCTSNDYHGIKSAINSGTLPVASSEQVVTLIDRTCSDCELIISYRDIDNDGYGDINEDTSACQLIPNGYVANNSDCNDMDSLLFPGQIWYLDSDNDGFGDSDNFVTSCLKPLNYVLNADDCDDTSNQIYPGVVEICDGIDNDCDGEIDEDVIVLDFAGGGGFDSLLMIPAIANIEDTVRVEVRYTHAQGDLPALFNPRLLMDYSGNGSYSNSNDLVFVLEELDPLDTDVTDGKIYFADLINLPTGQSYKSKVSVSGASGCSTEFGPFNTPDVLDPMDISIFANDITFSDNNPDENTAVTVSANIHNFSSFDAEDIVVRLENTYDGTIYTDITGLSIEADSDSIVSWVVTTPSVIAFVPFKVTIDYTDILPEPNELDNVAIRPLLVGDFTAGGEIVSSSQLNNSMPTAGGTIYLSGYAHYTNLPVTLQDSSVAGAQVEISIPGIDSSIIGVTNNNGYYSIPIKVGLTPDTFTVQGSVTDFTLMDSIPEVSFIVKPPVCAADLLPIFDFPNALLPTTTHISGTIRVKNQGCADVDTQTVLQVDFTNGLPDTYTLIVPPLATGEGTTFVFDSIALVSVSSVTICAAVDDEGIIPESNEINNRRCHLAHMQQDMQDLRVGPLCTDHTISPIDPSFPGMLNISSKIINSGNVDIPNDIEVSFATVDTTVFVIYPGGLLSGNDAFVSATLPTPTPGDQPIMVQVDPQDLIIETNESNNDYSNKLCFDYVAGQVIGQSLYPAATAFNVSANITNIGTYKTSSAPGIKTSIEVSGPGISGWLELANQYVILSGSCGAASIISSSGPFIAPEPGDFTFRVSTDIDSDYTECSESNNISLRTIRFFNTPDFRALSQYIAPSSLNPLPGDSISIDVTYENIGLTNIDSINLDVLVDDIFLDKIRVKGLLAGDFYSVSIPISWASSTAGVHVIKLDVNSDEENLESVLSNNQATRSIIVGAAPNFLITDLQSTIPSPLQGYPTSIVTEITNEGGAAGVAQLILSYIDESDSEIIIDTIGFSIASHGIDTLSQVWIPTITGDTEIKARILNSNPIEYNDLDNDSSIIINIQMTDMEDPVAVCQSINVYLDTMGQAILLPSDIDDGSSDNHVIDSMSISLSDFNCNDIGDHQVILTVWDPSNNSNTCMSTVTIVDSIAPTPECLDTIVYLDQDGVASIDLRFVESGSTDNCNVDSLSLSKADFDCTDLGIQGVLITAYDDSGNASTCTSSVTVSDTIAPMANCRDTIIYLDSMGTAQLVISNIDNGSTDNCQIANRTVSKSIFNCNDLGEQTITMKVHDISLNSDSCISQVTVMDTIAPVLECLGITMYLDEQGNYDITNSDIDSLLQGSYDNCAIDSIQLSGYNLDCGDIPATDVLISVWDGSLNFSSCIVSVAVIDTFGPILECHDLKLELNANKQKKINPLEAITSIFDCQLMETSLSRDSFSCIDIGIVNDIILTAVDSSGNSSTCSFDITISDPHGYCCPDQLTVSGMPIDSLNYYASDSIVASGLISNQQNVNFRSTIIKMDSITVDQGVQMQVINEDCSNQ